MLYMRTLLLCFTFILSATAGTDHFYAQRGPGYFGSSYGNPPQYSDYLRATFCYCATADFSVDEHDIPTFAVRKQEGHHFRYEYYHVHTNMTYILNERCRAPSDEDMTCLEEPERHFQMGFKPVRDESVCQFFHKDPSEQNTGVHITLPWDSLCLDVRTRPILAEHDYIMFAGQMRMLGVRGGQGRRSEGPEVVQKECSSLCSDSENFEDMNILWDNERAPNAVTVWETME